MTETATAEHPQGLLTRAEACGYLRIGKTKFFELLYAGEITPVRPPSPTGKRRMLLFERAELDAFVERNRVQA